MTGFLDGSDIGWIMQTTCTSLQIHNHTNTSSVNCFRSDVLPGAQLTVSVHLRTVCQCVIHRYSLKTAAGIELVYDVVGDKPGVGSRVCAGAQYAVLEANAKVNGRGPFSHPHPSETP